jgi:putative lipoic acid-binding regulatory protein
MTIYATSKRMTKNIAAIFDYSASISRAEVVNRARSSEGQFCSVTLAMMATEFAEASQVVKIISGEIEPP